MRSKWRRAMHSLRYPIHTNLVLPKAHTNPSPPPAFAAPNASHLLSLLSISPIHTIHFNSPPPPPLDNSCKSTILSSNLRLFNCQLSYLCHFTSKLYRSGDFSTTSPESSDSPLLHHPIQLCDSQTHIKCNDNVFILSL